MYIQSEKERRILREGGKHLADILNRIAGQIVPGVTTKELDAYAEKLIIKTGGTPSFKGYMIPGARMPYPAVLCTSVNDEIVHAIPSGRILKNGDIIGLDIGMRWNGLYTDTARTVGVGVIGKAARRLITVTHKALKRGIRAVRHGVRVGDVGEAIQSYIESEGYKVVKELVGHGVGRDVHEEPEIPNWGRAGTGSMLKTGMVIALEPMVNIGTENIRLDDDGWTWKTKDRSLSAHFEHTILVTDTGAEIITEE